MAALHLERKTRKKPVWPWLLILLIVIGIMAWLMLTETPSTANLLEGNPSPWSHKALFAASILC